MQFGRIIEVELVPAQLTHNVTTTLHLSCGDVVTLHNVVTM